MSRVLGLASLVLAIAAPLLAGGEAGKELRFSSPGQIREVRIDIPIAEIGIVNSDSERFELRGSVRQRYSGRDERAWAEAIVAATNIVVEVRGDHAFVRRELGPEADTWKAKKSPAQVRAVLYIPHGASIEVDQSIGELDIEGDFGDLDVEVKIGEVRIRVPKSNVQRLTASVRIGEVKTDLGDRTITKEGLFAGETYYENETGKFDVRVRLQIGEVEIELH